MTDYNDGKWHGWNGGECPVHPKSVIQAFYMMSGGAFPVEFKAEASKKIWSAPFIFRVVKEYRDPREFWIMTENGILRSYRASKPDVVPFGWECIHVREVTE